MVSTLVLNMYRTPPTDKDKNKNPRRLPEEGADRYPLRSRIEKKPASQPKKSASELQEAAAKPVTAITTTPAMTTNTGAIPKQPRTSSTLNLNQVEGAVGGLDPGLWPLDQSNFSLHIPRRSSMSRLEYSAAREPQPDSHHLTQPQQNTSRHTDPLLHQGDRTPERQREQPRPQPQPANHTNNQNRQRHRPKHRHQQRQSLNSSFEISQEVLDYIAQRLSQQQVQAPVPSHSPLNLSRVRNEGSKISKWGLSFSGRSDSLIGDEFLYRIEALARAKGVGYQELANNVHMVLKDEAAEWFWTQFCRDYPTFSWEIFKHEFQLQYQMLRTDDEIKREMLNLRQQPQEAFDSYLQRMTVLKNQLRVQPTEDDFIRLVKDNLHPRLATMVYTQPVTSILDLKQLCRSVERWFNIRQSFSKPPPRALSNIHEVSSAPVEEDFASDIEEDNAEVCALASTICWNCRQSGHIFKDCPSETRSLFCYKCGQADTITPKCPKCSGNRRPSGARHGTTRSQTSPAQQN